MMLRRISLLSRLPRRTLLVTRAIHIEADANEKVIPLSQFDLSKPLIGRTNGRLKFLTLWRDEVPVEDLRLSSSGTDGHLSPRSGYAGRFRIAQSSDHWHTQRRQEYLCQSTDGLESTSLCVPTILTHRDLLL